MHDRSSIDLINQTKRTRRIAYAFILLALALPSLFAWSENAPLESAIPFTGQLAAVTLLALIARQWMARHYPVGVQVQALLAFALVLLGWSGYESRLARDERAARAAPVSSMSSRVPASFEEIAVMGDTGEQRRGQFGLAEDRPHCGAWMCCSMAQLRHKPGNEKGLPLLEAPFFLVGRARFELSTYGLKV
jgi:hypothetical protein